jgi:prepilin-type N-terminal cleavage/methylation domain-containing protein/prepilin-type processing-associated H-X9-DG protein
VFKRPAVPPDHTAAAKTRQSAGSFFFGPKPAFTLVELLVVIGIIGVLIAILLPSLSNARAAAIRTQCASQFRQLGIAVQLYANTNAGWIPRDCTLGRPDRQPWMLQLAQQLDGGRDLPESALPDFRPLQCPSHPLTGRIPTTYVVNAFAFETQPSWAPDGPVKLTAVRNPSTIVWLAEASNVFDPDEFMIYEPRFADVYAPDHLPRQPRQRIADDRHANLSANVLHLDGHVQTIRIGFFTLEMFDDGLRTRATTPPPT